MLNLELPANVAAGAAAAHRIEHEFRLKIQEQVLDKIAAAITGIAPIAVSARIRTVIKAREAGDRTGIEGDPRKLDEDRTIGLVGRRHVEPWLTGCIERVDKG